MPALIVGILWREERAEKRDRAIPLMATGGVLTAIGFGIAALVGWTNHPWSGRPLVVFLVGFAIAAVGLVDVLAGALAFEFRTGPALPPPGSKSRRPPAP